MSAEFGLPDKQIIATSATIMLWMVGLVLIDVGFLLTDGICFRTSAQWMERAQKIIDNSRFYCANAVLGDTVREDVSGGSAWIPWENSCVL